jgi:mannose-1-phosphate guanylyltransferase
VKSNAAIFILAGGSGTRFWPVSRSLKPKQFLPLGLTSESLIGATARRVQELVPEGGLFVVTSKVLVEQVRAHVPTASVLAEPMGRNTAASIGLAAVAAAKKDPNTVVVILPADHAVRDEGTLREVLRRAITVAQSGDHLVTIGIRPAYPHTGYGYVQRGETLASSGGVERAFKVKRFFEKPNLDRARSYCDSGDFFWNSGMFAWRASVILAALKQCLPQLHEGLLQIQSALGTPREAEVLEQIFPTLESISIDFGVLEHVRNCAVVEADDFGWNDVGSWDAWADQFEKDGDGNVLQGDAAAVLSSNCVVRGCPEGKRLIALLGVENTIVIDTPDALLVCHQDRVQDVKKVLDELKAKGKQGLL